MIVWRSSFHFITLKHGKQFFAGALVIFIGLCTQMTLYFLVSNNGRRPFSIGVDCFGTFWLTSLILASLKFAFVGRYFNSKVRSRRNYMGNTQEKYEFNVTQ